MAKTSSVMGRNAAPAWSGLRPRAPWKYCVRKKNIAYMPLTTRMRAA